MFSRAYLQHWSTSRLKETPLRPAARFSCSNRALKPYGTGNIGVPEFLFNFQPEELTKNFVRHIITLIYILVIIREDIMPPKVKIPREAIIEKAFELTKSIWF